MLRPILTILLSTTLFSHGALAGNVNLFIVQKPENPQNLIQVFVPESNCRMGAIDFHWWMDGTKFKPMNEMLKQGTRSRISEIEGRADHPGACPSSLPAGTSCQAKFLSLADIRMVNHGQRDPSMVIRAVKTPQGCNITAYMEIDNQVTRVKKVVAEGEKLSTNIFSMSVTVRIDGVKIQDLAADGRTPVQKANWR